MADSIFTMKQIKSGKFQPLEKKWHNDFQDDLKESAEDLKIIGTQKQTERGTRISKKIDVTCTLCGKTESISQSLYRPTGEYRCNNCCTNKGRNKRNKVQ